MRFARFPPGLAPTHPAACLATWFGTGLLPWAPGSWGSLAALPVAWLILWRWGPGLLLAAAAALFVVGLWAAAVYIERAKDGDPASVVIDEVVGQWLALVPAAAGEWWQFAAGFVLFRTFDIVKPWPANWIDRRLKGGLAVMLDDVAAGLYAAICLLLINMI